MRIYLARHGEYDSLDYTNPLTEQGKSVIHGIGKFLKQSSLRVDNIFHSGKLRAEQTANILQAYIHSEHGVSYQQGITPNEEINFIIEQLHFLNADNLWVGHLPYMSRLVSQLLIQQPNIEIVTFHPGTIVCLEQVYAGWQLSWVLNPALFQTK